ncbi:tyrosine-type recombinase/integrase [Planctomycetota bacterium]
MNQLIVPSESKSLLSSSGKVPNVLSDAGGDVVKVFLTFFTDQIRNPNTRQAYLHNAVAFFEWCGDNNLSFADIESFHISGYIEQHRQTKSDATVKQHLASIKMLFDWMVIQQIVPRNPAAAVRGPKIVIRKGKTPVFDEAGAKEFFASFENRATEEAREMHVVELRDRAFCAVMTYAMPRVSSVCGMLNEDFYLNGTTWWLRFSHGKGGVHHEMPAHHKLVEYLHAYLDAASTAGLPDVAGRAKAGEKKGLLFRSTRGQTRLLTERPLRRQNALDMVKRRAKDAGIQMNICNHTFRGSGITNYMKNGGSLKKARDMAAHADTRTTMLYDHSGDQATLDEVERIHI